MPAWQPNWVDVRFNYGAAEAAASSLDAGSAGMRSSYDAVHGEHRTRGADWEGAHRDTFRKSLDSVTSTAANDMQMLKAAAARIRQAALSAQHEQHARVAARAQWQAESAAEERARQAAIAAETARQAAAAGVAKAAVEAAKAAAAKATADAAAKAVAAKPKAA